MIITTHFNRDTARLTKFIWYKKQQYCMEVRYDLMMNCYNYLQVDSTRKQTLSFEFVRGGGQRYITRKKLRIYIKDFEEWEIKRYSKGQILVA